MACTLQVSHCLANTPQDCVEPELEGKKEEKNV
jgi:hypothetical protein